MEEHIAFDTIHNMLTPLPDASRYDQVAAHAFSHTAMACPWGIIILGGTARAAAHAARAAFEEVDRLEQELSRFIPHSDVARLNTHPVGEWLLLGPDCLDCLRIALRMHDQTLAAFDPTLGAAVDRHRTAVGPVSNRSLRDPDALGPVSNRSGTVGPVCNRSEQEIRESGPARPVENRSSSAVPGRLEIDFASRRARRLAEDVQVDLGALGKGYAIDCAAALLREWGVGSAAIHSGQSTVFAMVAAEADPPWRVALRDPGHPAPEHGHPAPEHGHVELRNAALSGSAMRIRGRHIIDPRTGRPAEGPRAAWCQAPSAAESDALSTAFMILPRESVRACLAAAPERRAWLLSEHLETEPPAPLRVALSGPRSGFIELEIGQGERILRSSFSGVVVDSLKELVTAIAKLAKGIDQCSATLYEEPGVCELEFVALRDQLTISATAQQDWRPTRTNAHPTAEFHCSRTQTCLAFWRAFRQIQSHCSAEEFERQWHSPFPSDSVDEIGRILKA